MKGNRSLQRLYFPGGWVIFLVLFRKRLLHSVHSILQEVRYQLYPFLSHKHLHIPYTPLYLPIPLNTFTYIHAYWHNTTTTTTTHANNIIFTHLHIYTKHTHIVFAEWEYRGCDICFCLRFMNVARWQIERKKVLEAVGGEDVTVNSAKF